MDNLNQKIEFKHGHIYLETDENHAVSGQELNGRVHLYLTQPFPAASLDIVMKGIEAVKWVSGEGTENKRKHEKINTLTDTRQIIYSFPQSIAMPGQYTFPFRILIPAGLPCSLMFAGTRRSRAMVNYSLFAILKPEENTTLEEMKYKTDISMREPIENIRTDFDSCIESKINSWFGLRKHGEVKLKLKFDKDFYLSNEMVVVQCDIDNSQCKIPIKKIKMSLKQVIKLKSGTGTFLNRYTKWKNYYEGIPKREQTGESSKVMEMNLKFVNGNINRGLEEIFTLETTDITLLTKQLQPSTSGTYANISYIVSVKLYYGIKSRRSTKCEVPIIIQPCEEEEDAKVEAPEGWSPIQIQQEGDIEASSPSLAASPEDIQYVDPEWNQNLKKN
ncbi:unnamed protein product [Moneuplotes crassus]|uniref:Arrestin C-terminal-like domain-containing protein n=1 Tax=Euplotes crassus TaxID=5936 RepID=A0AAD1UJU2_EUPCR|nr:unnamed protein product [Moneuplotes crassus]